MINRLLLYRFELFLLTQLAILFGSLFVPSLWFENWFSPLLYIVNLGIGCLFAYHKKLLFSVLTGLLFLGGGISIFQMLGMELQEYYSFIKLGSFFLFYSLVSLEIIKQVAKAKTIKRNVILGLMSGYISLGFLAFFLFLTIEIIEPDSFSGLIIAAEENPNIKEELFYFSYVTLLTIGYGEILPVSDLAQKGAILVALVGQFYLVILTAIVVGKYINQNN